MEVTTTNYCIFCLLVGILIVLGSSTVAAQYNPGHPASQIDFNALITNPSDHTVIKINALPERIAAIDFYEDNANEWGIGIRDNTFYIDEFGEENRLTILHGGFVGIGTANPQYTLDVAGGIRTTGDICTSLRCLDTLEIAGVEGVGTQGYVPRWASAGETLEDSAIYNDPTTGNVGIGTPNPEERLDVQGNNIATKIRVKNTDGSVYLVLDRGSDTASSRILLLDQGTHRWEIGTIGSDDFEIYDHSSMATAMEIESVTGNVGIGAEPQGKFHVSPPPGSPGNTGLKSPSATGEDYTGWTLPANAYTSNNQWASKQSSGSCAVFVDLSWNSGASYTNINYFVQNNGPTDTTSTAGGSTDTWGWTWLPVHFTNDHFRLRITSGDSFNPDFPENTQDYYNFNFPDLSEKIIRGIEVVVEGHCDSTVATRIRYVDHIQVNVYYEELSDFIVTADGVGIGTAYVDYKLEVKGTAGKPGGGSWSDSSDVRLKKNVKELEGALDKLTTLQGVTFEWVNPELHGNLDGVQAGLIAQDVEKIFPEWVGEIGAAGKDSELIPEGEKIKSLQFPHGFNAYLVEAIKELRAEKDTEIAQLHAKIDALEKDNNQLKQILCRNYPEACESMLDG